MRDLGSSLRRARRKARLSQEAVAELAGIHPKYLGEIERGIKNPTALIVNKLAEALGIPVCELLSRERCPMKE